jgi:hypothetical protein
VETTSIELAAQTRFVAAKARGGIDRVEPPFIDLPSALLELFYLELGSDRLVRVVVADPAMAVEAQRDCIVLVVGAAILSGTRW